MLSCGMDDAQEQDQYEERLKEVFNSFDASGCGSLCPEELSDLCLSLHLDDATPALLQTLLQKQDRLTARVRLFLPLRCACASWPFGFSCVEDPLNLARRRCRATPALRSLCLRARWCFVSRLVEEKMWPPHHHHRDPRCLSSGQPSQLITSHRCICLSVLLVKMHDIKRTPV